MWRIGPALLAFTLEAAGYPVCCSLLPGVLLIGVPGGQFAALLALWSGAVCY